MQSNSTGRWLSTAAAAAFTFGGLKILLGDTLTTPSAWSTYHVLTVLTVFGTVCAGHLTGDAFRAKRWLSVIGFAALFAAGTTLVVYQSVGRQAETADTKALTAKQTNDAIALKASELTEANKRLVRAHEKVELQINGGIDKETGEKVKKGCFDVCEGWKQQRRDITVVVKSLEAELAKLGPQKPVNAEAEKFGEIAALFGYDKSQAVAVFTLTKPFLWTLFFEVGSIISIGFAFRHDGNSQKPENTRATEPATGSNDNSCPPTNDGTRATVALGNRTVASRARAEADVIRIVARGEQLPNQDELASRWGIHKGTASKWLADFERRGLVTRERDGRNKRVAAA